MLQKLHLKELFKTIAEAPGDLNGNKVTDEITSADKSKNNGKEEDNEANKM